MANHLIQVFEHEKLKYSENKDFTKSHFDALVLFNEKNENKYFTPIHKGVQFHQYVGVIQVGGLTIEILPKVDKRTKTTDKDKKLWQDVLLNMLRICKKINVENVSETQLKKRYNSILEVYYELYLNEVKSLIKKGLIKKYRKQQSNQKALKGKMIFNKNIQKNLIHKERFYCEHQVYDKDHLIHSVIYKGLKILEVLVSPKLKDRLNRLHFEMIDFKEIPINEKHFGRIKLNRKTQVYHNAIEIAKMLILNYSPNISSGNNKMITLLFDMNKLWEEYIYRVLLRYKPEGYKVEGQNSKKFWEGKSIRPDIVITNTENQERLIIDTKWKVVDNKKPSDDDLRQMFAYNLLWESERSILLYPKVNQKDSDYGKFIFKPVDRNTFLSAPGEYDNSLPKRMNTCKLAFIDVIGDGVMKSNHTIADEIFGKT